MRLFALCFACFFWLGCNMPPGDDHEGCGGEGGGASGSGGSVVPPPACPFSSQCDPFAAPEVSKDECADANPKTIDRCTGANPCGGVCAHVRAQCDGLDPLDWQQMACDDSNPCTADACALDSACTHVPAADGIPCSNGVCLSGICSE